MSIIKKTQPYNCPQCGNQDSIECYQTIRDDDVLQEFYKCNNCQSQWLEYFGLEWDGYTYNKMDYDENGKPMRPIKAEG